MDTKADFMLLEMSIKFFERGMPVLSADIASETITLVVEPLVRRRNLPREVKNRDWPSGDQKTVRAPMLSGMS